MGKPAVITPPTNLIECCHGDRYSGAWGSGIKRRKSRSEARRGANCTLLFTKEHFETTDTESDVLPIIESQKKKKKKGKLF